MKKKIILFIVLIVSSINFSISQKLTVLQDKSLASTPGKNLRYCNKEGIKCCYKGAGPLSGGASLGFADMGEAGFLYRDQFKITYYNNDFEKKWEKELKPEMNYTNNDFIDIIGSENSGYLIEKGTKKTSITKFSIDGTVLQVLLENKEIGDIYDNDFYGYGAINDNLYILISNYNSKNKKRLYHLIKYNSKMEREIIKIDLPHDEYENDKFDGKDDDGFDYKDAAWALQTQSSDKIYFKKEYAKDIPNEKKRKELKMAIADYSTSNAALNFNNFEFDNAQFPYLAFKIPNVNINLAKDELTLFENFSNDDVKLNSVDGFYIIKYKLSNKKIIYSKSILYKDLIAKMNGEGKLKESVKTYLGTIGSVRFILGDEYVESGNFNVTIHASTSGANSDKVLAYQIRLNAIGEIVKIDESSYLNHPRTFQEYRLWPIESSTKFKTSDCAPSVYDFIYSQAGKVETNYLLSKIYRRKDFYTIVYINDANSELRGIKIKIE